MNTVDRLAQAFAIGNAPEKDEYRFGTVKAINDDGSVYVQLAQGALTRCSCLYDASVGDRVQVCIKANGQAVVLGSIGKSDEPKPLVPYVLYDNASGTNGSVALSDSAANYSLMEIYCRCDDSQTDVNSIKVANPNNKVALAAITCMTVSAMWHKCRALLISGTSISTAAGDGGHRYGHWYFNGGGYNHLNAIYVTKVIGYKQ